MVQFGVIADDFTGACDVGIQFKKYGLETLVLADMEALDEIRDFDVIVIDTESRSDSSDAAYNKVRNIAGALKKIGVRLVYKKIDSTLRGNIGEELNSIMDELNLKAAIVAPAFPETKRTTVDGRQLVNGIPLDKTEFAHDPTNPVKESHIPTLLQRQTRRRVGTVNLPKVREGIESLRREVQTLVENGYEVLVADAETRNDLKIIAKAALTSGVLPCGSAGLANGVSYWLTSSAPEPRVLVVSGSVNTVTLNQISAAEKKLNVHVLEPDLLDVLMSSENRKAEVDRLVEEAKKAVTKGRDIIIRLAKSKDAIYKIQQFSRELGMNYIEAVEKVLSFLGELSRAVIDSCKIGDLILVGGVSAIKVINAIGAYGIRIEEEVLAGIPSGRILGGPVNGLPTITKAGGFGREDALVEAMRKLKEKSSIYPN